MTSITMQVQAVIIPTIVERKILKVEILSNHTRINIHLRLTLDGNYEIRNFLYFSSY